MGMGQTVKAKAAKTVLQHPIRRQGIRCCASRQPRVEGGVEASYRGQIRIHGSDGLDPSQRAILVQRRQRSESTDSSLNIGIEPHGARIPRSTVNHPVSDGIRLGQPTEPLDDYVRVDAAIGQLHIMARENCQRTINDP
jgi:hypothetical protein